MSMTILWMTNEGGGRYKLKELFAFSQKKKESNFLEGSMWNQK